MIISLDIDAQKTFSPLCPEELPIVEGDKIVDELNAQAELANLRVMTKDAHCLKAVWINEDPKKNATPAPFVNAPHYWVAHGIVGSYGFELLDGLPQETDYDFCVWKGVSPALHPYGACYHDFEEKLSTGLIEWLKDKQAKILIVGGLATDYCVKTTVMQLVKKADWKIILNLAACRGIAEDSTKSALDEMQKAGVIICENALEIKNFLNK